MTLRAGLLPVVLLLAACSSRKYPLDRQIEEDPSASNYYQRAHARWTNNWPNDLPRTLSIKMQALEDLDRAVALEDPEESWYLSRRGLWRAEMFKLTRDEAWRERSLADFAEAERREPREERNLYFRGQALLTCFDDAEGAVTILLGAYRSCQGRADVSSYELDILKRLSEAYAALAKAAAGKPEAAQYRELAQSTSARHDELYRIRNRSRIESLEAERRAKEQAREDGYRTAAAREAARDAQRARDQEAERRFWESRKPCDKCSGRGWNFRMGYTEHKVDTVETDKGTVIRSTMKSVPSGGVACTACVGLGHVPRN